MTNAARNYQVDSDMVGDDQFPGYSHPMFCAHLQSACDEAGLEVTIECIIDSSNGATNEDSDLVPDALFWGTLTAYEKSITSTSKDSDGMSV